MTWVCKYPNTREGWARYYADRPGAQALALSFWYLLLKEAFE